MTQAESIIRVERERGSCSACSRGVSAEGQTLLDVFALVTGTASGEKTHTTRIRLCEHCAPVLSSKLAAALEGGDSS